MKSKRDFGVGWTMEVKRGRLSHNRKPGLGWRFPTGAPPFYTRCINGATPTLSHVTEVRLSDREVFKFALEMVNTTYGLIGQGCIADARFVQIGGTRPGATLDIVGHNTVTWAFDSNQVLDELTQQVFDPGHVILTTPEGVQVELNRAAGGVVRMKDLNDNELYFTNSGITHSSGRGITFVRDAQRRITEIIDPSGGERIYAYDAAGDLVSFKDPEGYETTFTYEGQHYLKDIVNALGVRAVRNEYDESGRLIATIDALGRRVEFTHDIDGQEEIIRNRLGHPTRMVYDDRGNVLLEEKYVTVNGQLTPVRTRRTYDANDNTLTETDALGRTSTMTYDANSNMLSKTDALGHTTSWTYNARNQRLTETDALGYVARTRYDFHTGDPVAETDRLGHTSTNTYERGLLTSTKDPLGNVTRYRYDAFGNVREEEDALGHITTRTHDSESRLLTETRTRTHEGVLVTVTTSKTYDKRGLVLGEMDGNGYVARTEYDALSRVSARVDKNGHRRTYEYSETGDLLFERFADGTYAEHTYDVEGRKTSTRDRGGRTTFFDLDEMGRTFRTRYADTSEVNVELDLVGNQVARVNELGHRTTFGYDALNRRTRITDPLDHSTLFGFDEVGNQTSITDANEHTTTFVFDAEQRRTATLLPDGEATSTVYDEAGRVEKEVDQNGYETNFGYDPLGRLVEVRDAENHLTSYGYDEVGNRTSQTDANLHTTSFAFDNVGRMVKRTLPLGQYETKAFDPNGNLLSLRNFNGEAIRYFYDSNDREIRKEVPNEIPVVTTYTPAGQRDTVTDLRGVTAYAYDLRYRVLEVDAPEGRVGYSYDLAGNRTSVASPGGTTSYGFDLAERMETVTAPGIGAARYVRDAVGNALRLEHANGTVTTRAFDELNRILEVHNTGPGGPITSHAYTLGRSGERLAVEELDGRNVVWSYDRNYQLLSETITDPVSGDHSFAVSYDPVGNRTSSTDGASFEAYAHDPNDRLLSAGSASFGHDDSGNLTAMTNANGTTNFRWSAENRLMFASTPSAEVQQTYDSDGVRVERVVDGEAIDLIVDRALALAEVLEERDAVGALVALYVHGEEVLLQSKGGDASVFHQDALGSTRALTDGTGGKTDSYSFEAFGTLLNHTGPTEVEFLFAGEQLDVSTGQYYLRARYLDPARGRFLSRDPFGGAITRPPTLHPYTYAENDPVRRVDPSGEFTLTEITVATGILGVVTGIAVPNLTRDHQRRGERGVDDSLGERVGECLVDHGGPTALVIVSIALGIDYGGVPIPKTEAELSRLAGNQSYHTTRLSRFNAVFNQWLRRHAPPAAHALGKVRFFRRLGRLFSAARYVTTPVGGFAAGYVIGLVPGCVMASL